jgi:hypothetical protein
VTTTPTKIADFPQVIREALSIWQAFRQLGFKAEELFLGVNGGDDAGDKEISMQLHTQGRCFSQEAGIYTGTAAEFEALFKKLAQIFQKAPQAELWANLESSEVFKGGYSHFVIALLLTGIHLPQDARAGGMLFQGLQANRAAWPAGGDLDNGNQGTKGKKRKPS